jgi:hypothetical protein
MNCLNFACQLYRMPFVTVAGTELKAVQSVFVGVNEMDLESMNQQLECGNRLLTKKKDLEMFFEHYCQVLGNLPWKNILATHPESVSVGESNKEIIIPAIVFNGGGNPKLGTFTTQDFIIHGVGGNYVFLMEERQSKA